MEEGCESESSHAHSGPSWELGGELMAPVMEGGRCDRFAGESHWDT